MLRRRKATAVTEFLRDALARDDVGVPTLEAMARGAGLLVHEREATTQGWRGFFVDFVPLSNTTSSTARLWINRKSWSGFHGFSSERNFSIHKVPLETYMSKLCVYFLIAPSAGFLIQPATMWKTHTPTVLVDAGIVLSKRALPDEYRQINPSSCSHLYPLSLMISVCSSSPHLSL